MEEELAKKAEVLKNLAVVNAAQQDFDASLRNAESALEIYEKLGDKHNMVAMHMNIQLLDTGGWGGAREDKALKHLEAIAALVDKAPDSMDKALVYQRTARAYLHRGQPATTLTWAQKTVDMLDRLGVSMGTSLGTAWTYIGWIDEGIAYNEKNWPPVQKAGNPIVIAILGGDLCVTLALVRDIPRARGWGETILPEAIKFGIPTIEACLRRPLTLIYALSGEMAKAEEACQAVKSIESKMVAGGLFEDVAG